MVPSWASARTCAEVFEIVVPLSIRISPVIGSTMSPQATRPSSFAAALASEVSTVSVS